jgi:UDP-N-acetylmuramoylalanine--D-glutamate ligase
MEKVLVLGKGISGTSAKRLLEEKGFLVTFANTDELIREENFSFVVLSPGIALTNPLVEKLSKKFNIISEIDLAFRYTECKIIAVTGTNGKSSLVSYLGYMFDAKVCGNIGTAASDVLPYVKKDDFAILEISSYQLDITKEKKIDVGILLKVTPDHLNRYITFENYLNSKLRIKDLIKDGGIFLQVEEKDFPPGKFFDGPVMEIIRYLEKNVGGDIFRADTFFKPLEHRLEFVIEKDGVEYINDSKATNPESTSYAVGRINKPKIMLLGGSEKESDFSPWNQAFKNNVKCVICYGQVGEKIKKALHQNFIVYRVEKMKDAIKKAKTVAEKGDVILLSPGAPSFDEFSAFTERGSVFKREVLNE